MPMPTFPLAQLGQFRSELHACFPCRADALFELGDALLCTPAITSVARLSLEPSHRRGWGSAYDALANGRINVDWLRDLLVRVLPPADPLVFAVDQGQGAAGRRRDRPVGVRAAEDQSPRLRATEGGRTKPAGCYRAGHAPGELGVGLLMSRSTGGFGATVCHLGGAAALAVAAGSSATTARPIVTPRHAANSSWSPGPCGM
jgi:hypothetical protein